MASSIMYRQVETLVASNSTLVVTLDTELADTNYTIGIEVPYQTSYWVTSKSSSGFTLNVGSTSESDQTINFLLMSS